MLTIDFDEGVSQPRSQGLSSSLPLERERRKGKRRGPGNEVERIWVKGERGGGLWFLADEGGVVDKNLNLSSKSTQSQINQDAPIAPCPVII